MALGQVFIYEATVDNFGEMNLNRLKLPALKTVAELCGVIVRGRKNKPDYIEALETHFGPCGPCAADAVLGGPAASLLGCVFSYLNHFLDHDTEWRRSSFSRI